MASSYKWDTAAKWNTSVYTFGNFYVHNLNNSIKVYPVGWWGVGGYTHDSGVEDSFWDSLTSLGDFGGLTQMPDSKIIVNIVVRDTEAELLALSKPIKDNVIPGKREFEYPDDFPADLTGLQGRWILVEIYINWGYPGMGGTPNEHVYSQYSLRDTESELKGWYYQSNPYGAGCMEVVDEPPWVVRPKYSSATWGGICVAMWGGIGPTVVGPYPDFTWGGYQGNYVKYRVKGYCDDLTNPSYLCQSRLYSGGGTPGTLRKAYNHAWSAGHGPGDFDVEFYDWNVAWGASPTTVEIRFFWVSTFARPKIDKFECHWDYKEWLPTYVRWVEVTWHTEEPEPIPPPEPTFECEDIRVFGTICADTVQDKAIVPIKIGEGEIRKGSLYDGADGATIENLVKGQTTFADSLHGHKSIQDLYDEWAKRWYYKKIQYKPQAKPAEDQNNGASIIGFKTTRATSNIFPPSSNIDNVDEALYVLSLYMKYLRNRTFPVIQETMHTSGRMLNLTFVPLPDNHLNGKWYDGTPVNEDQCSWIVSPAFLWGLGGCHCPWAFLCTTFGLGIGGDNDPNETWAWDDWLRFMGLLLNGQILFGRWLIYFFISSAEDILTALATILATHANYNVVGTHWWGTAEEQKVVDHRTYKLEASNWISTPDISYIDVDKYKIKGSFDGNRDREIEADCGVDGIRIVRIVGCAPLLIPNETIITVTPAILTLNLTKIRFKECYVNDRTGKFLKAQPTGQGGDRGMRADDPYVPPDIGWSPWRNPIE